MRLFAALFILCSSCAIASSEGEPPDPVVVVEPAKPVTTTAPAEDGAAKPVNILAAPEPSQGGMDALGSFKLEYDAELNCLFHVEEDNNGEPGTGGRLVIVWPFGYSASLDDTGKVTVFDERDQPVTATGVPFEMGGGFGELLRGNEPGACDAIGAWYANGPPLVRG